jgi:hypothetical protein
METEDNNDAHRTKGQSRQPLRLHRRAGGSAKDRNDVTAEVQLDGGTGLRLSNNGGLGHRGRPRKSSPVPAKKSRRRASVVGPPVIGARQNGFRRGRAARDHEWCGARDPRFARGH